MLEVKRIIEATLTSDHPNDPSKKLIGLGYICVERNLQPSKVKTFWFDTLEEWKKALGYFENPKVSFDSVNLIHDGKIKLIYGNIDSDLYPYIIDGKTEVLEVSEDTLNWIEKKKHGPKHRFYLGYVGPFHEQASYYVWDEVSNQPIEIHGTWKLNPTYIDDLNWYIDEGKYYQTGRTKSGYLYFICLDENDISVSPWSGKEKKLLIVS